MDFTNVKQWIIPEGTVKSVSDSLGRVIWQESSPHQPNYFYVEDISGSDNTLSIVKRSSNTPTIEVFSSTDMVNWNSMGTTSTTAITATIPSNGKLYLKANTNQWSSGYYGAHNKIKASGNHNVGGNVMSLLYDDNFENQTTFASGSTRNFTGLFYGDTTLVNTSDLILPATTLTDYCYQQMFEGCTSLTTAPATLPATTLANNCYQYMFYGCTSLTTAPALPATTLADGCYSAMFHSCSSLTTALVLPATILRNSCYNAMFQSCTSLNTVTTYADNISASNCLTNWLFNVSATGNFYNLGGATYTSGASGIPTGWTEHRSL